MSEPSEFVERGSDLETARTCAVHSTPLYKTLIMSRKAPVPPFGVEILANNEAKDNFWTLFGSHHNRISIDKTFPLEDAI